jgi:flagellar motor switch protein FliM
MRILGAREKKTTEWLEKLSRKISRVELIMAASLMGLISRLLGNVYLECGLCSI